MLKALTNFFTSHDFEDMIFVKFNAQKESDLLEVRSFTPITPPFNSKEVDVYRNKAENLVFVEAFGENPCFIRHLVYSLGLAYPQPSQEGEFKNKYYIFTDNQENFDCPPLFFIIPTKRNDLYQKVSELKEQIMPEPEKAFPFLFYDPNTDDFGIKSQKAHLREVAPTVKKDTLLQKIEIWLNKKIIEK